MATTDSWPAWCADVGRAADHPAQWPEQLRPLRDRAWRLGPVADGALALGPLWATASADVTATWLAPLLEDLALPTAFRGQLAQCAATHRDHRVANAALTVLGHGEGLSPAAWRAIGRRAARERPAVAPDSDCAVFLARHGPRHAWASVALCAFRSGPDDVDDRLVSLGHLGRFGEPRTLPWLRSVVSLGAAHLEVIQSAAHALASGADKSAWTDLLAQAGGAAVGLDAWARWTALEGLCFHLDRAARPWVLAALAAGGDDLPAGYADGLRALLARIDPEQPADLAAVRAALQRAGRTAWPQLPAVQDRLFSRDARVAREAAVAWASAGRDPAVLAARAGQEATLVAHGCLIGSLLPPASAVPVDVAAWSSVADCLPAADRAALQAQEDLWLAGA